MPEPILSVRSVTASIGGSTRLGTPEQQARARSLLVAAILERHICEALAAEFPMPDDERQRLGLLLLSGGK